MRKANRGEVYPKHRMKPRPSSPHQRRANSRQLNPLIAAPSPILCQISPEEEERRRVRRERNKLAAAKCRNRRKELTDFLQAVSTGPSRGTPAPRSLRGPLPWSFAPYPSSLCEAQSFWERDKGKGDLK
jgi:hypothetical protein